MTINTAPDRLAADADGQRFGTFSYLPAMDSDQLRAQIQHLVAIDLDAAIEHAAIEDSAAGRAGERFWQMWHLPFFGERDVDAIESAIETCRLAYPSDVIRLIGYDKLRQTQAAAFVVHDPHR
ncbi:MAG: ribulose bisphosphate carboxylase small subunit [Actinomycetota bacterium]